MTKDQLEEMNVIVFERMKDQYNKGDFGFPIGLGIHFGNDTGSFLYQETPTQMEMIKNMFIAMMRMAMDHFSADWAIVTMDSKVTKMKADADPKLWNTMKLDELVEAGLATRHSSLVQIAQTKSGLFHMVSALETDGVLGETEITKEEDNPKFTGNLMMFQEVSPFIKSLIDHYGVGFMEGIKTLKMQEF